MPPLSWKTLRFLLAVMVGAYLAINLLLLLILPLIPAWPLYGVTALVVPPMVLMMVYLVIPLARRA